MLTFIGVHVLSGVKTGYSVRAPGKCYYHYIIACYKHVFKKNTDKVLFPCNKVDLNLISLQSGCQSEQKQRRTSRETNFIK